MAKACLAKGVVPELIIVSDAKRTQETWKLVSPVFPDAKTLFTEELFLASAEKIIKIISQVDSFIDCIMIIGHNPGITEALCELANVRVDNTPTSGIGCISCQINNFEKITDSGNYLEYFIYPKIFFAKN